MSLNSSSARDSLYDIIIPLPSHVVDDLINNGVHVFPRPWLYFAPIPPHVRRVWIYEDGEEAITIMVSLNRYALPNHLYFLTNPLYAEIMVSHYDFHPSLIPRVAPIRILRRFSRHLSRIW